jgi:hypothetical protein
LLVVRRRAADTGEGTGAHDRDEDAGPSLAPWIALGVGAAAGIAALVTGLVAHGIYGDLTETCTNDVCSPTEEREIDRGRDFATVSTVLTAVAIAGAAAGVVLYFVTGDDGAGGEAASAGPLLAPVAGGAVAGVEGRL